jgi:prolyl-tRNA synthetase
MGCYGIGIGRLMASIVEVHHDDFGPVWPQAVAPFAVHCVALNLSDQQKSDFSDAAYTALVENGIETVYDDRNERAGIQFADADLIGAPLRLVFSAKNFDSKRVEWKKRDNSGKGMIGFDEIVPFVKQQCTSTK